MITTQQVLNAIEEFEDSQEFWFEAGSAFGVKYGGDDYSKLTIDGVDYPVKQVESTGGMDKGSNASITFSVGDQYFKKEGYYASHYGYDWDGAFYEVRPVQVEVTQYERV